MSMTCGLAFALLASIRLIWAFAAPGRGAFVDKIRPKRTLWAAGALGAGLIVAVPSQASGPEPLSPESWLTVDDNSPEATRLSLDGPVTVQLVVRADRRLTACSLVKGSGHDVLVEHTCQWLSSRARLKPATASTR